MGVEPFPARIFAAAATFGLAKSLPTMVQQKSLNLAFIELALPEPKVSVDFLSSWLALSFSQPQADYWLSQAAACRLGLFRQKNPQDIAYLQAQALVFFQVEDLVPLLEKLVDCQGVIKKAPKFLPGFGTYVTVADAAGLCWGVIASDQRDVGN
jgi:predicted enzyme related to lactoylglutathione lyase